MLGRFREFLVPGERRLLEDIEKLLDLGEKSLEILIQLLASEARTRGDVAALTAKITELEKEGDVIVREMERSVATGAISPPLIDDFLRLSERVDGILDLAHSISREVSRVQKYRGDKLGTVEGKVYRKVAELVGLGLSAVRELRNMIVTAKRRPKELALYTENIESIEEEADDMKDALLDEIYASAEQLPYYVYSHLVRLTLQGDDLSDRCEDASDLIAITVAALGL